MIDVQQAVERARRVLVPESTTTVAERKLARDVLALVDKLRSAYAYRESMEGLPLGTLTSKVAAAEPKERCPGCGWVIINGGCRCSPPWYALDVTDVDVDVVCEAATEQVERLRWLGYPEQREKADQIEAAVERLRSRFHGDTARCATR